MLLLTRPSCVVLAFDGTTGTDQEKEIELANPEFEQNSASLSIHEALEK